MTMTSTSPSRALLPGDFLKVDNTRNDQPLRLTWDGRTSLIPAGKIGVATYEQVINHLGNPASGTAPIKIHDESGAFSHVAPPREEERARISVKQGWDLGSSATGGLQVLVPPPDVRVFDMENNRIWTVMEDPTGEHQMPSGGGQDFGHADQMARLERQMAALRMQMQVNAGSADLGVPGLGGPESGGLPDLDVPGDDD